MPSRTPFFASIIIIARAVRDSERGSSRRATDSAYFSTDLCDLCLNDAMSQT